MTLIGLLLMVVAAVLAVPVLVLLLQTLLAPRMPALPVAMSAPEGAAPSASAAVLIPAHNEQDVIGETVRVIRAQLRPADRLVVVADNCTDETAQVARAAGAEVLERTDKVQRGKGYALAHGLSHIAHAPCETLIIVDADCHVLPGSIQRLAQIASAAGRPVQALDLMLAPECASVKQRVAEWAWRIKNWLRPMAWKRLGMPCQLMGTGMAFPWPIAQHLQLANGHLAEDMMLGVELALAGTPAQFCDTALVTSTFPSTDAAQHAQRKRWEHGHLSVMLKFAPRLMARGIGKRDMRVVALALDLFVPPVALLGVLLVFSATCALMHLFAGGGALPLLAMIFLTFAFTCAVWRAWSGWGRDLLSGKELLELPLYLIRKFPIYASFLLRRQKEWVKTDRR